VIELHYTVDGPDRAPVLVLAASLGTTGAIWQPQLPALAQHFRVVRFDHRGHGRSPVPAGPYRLDDLGGDVLALLDTLGAGRVHIGGASLGGAVAAWVAATAPDRVDRLAMLATSARFGTPELWVERAASVRAGGMAAIADQVVGRWFTPGFAQRHGAVVGWVRHQLVTTPVEAYASCCAALEQLDLGPLLPSIAAPTLAVAGADDPVSPPEDVHQLAGAIPNATVDVVAESAHLLNVEQPDRVARTLVDFFLGGMP
jgi:3-oxoadipate enol-lactonase